jgi:hypothetical protein
MVTLASLKLEVDASGMTAGVNQAAQSATRAGQSIDALAGRLDTLSDEIRNSYNQAGLGATAAAERAAAAAQRWAISEENASKRASAAIDANIQSAQRLVEAVEQVSIKIDSIGSRPVQGPKKVGADLDAATDKAIKLNRAIGAVGEVSQVGSRVRLLGEEIRGLGSGFGSAAGVAGALSGALIDVAQVSAKTGGSLSSLAVVLRANPILAAGAVLSAIAAAMALFGGNTRDTNSELSKQIRLQEELRRASVDLATQLQRDQDLNRVGFPVDDQQLQFTRARRYSEVASGLAGQKGVQSFGDLQALTGLSQQALVDLAPSGGVATQLRQGLGLGGGVGGNEATRLQAVGLTNEAAREVLLLLARSLKTNADFLPSGLAGGTDRVNADPSLFPTVGIYGGLGASSPYGPSPAMPGVGYGSAIGPSPAGLSPFDQGRISNEIADAARASAEFEERLRTLRDLGNDVGSALGNAFGSMVFNISNARQALAGFLQQLSAIGQQQITRGFGNAVANLFTPSAAQVATSNPLMNPGAIGPQLPPGA